jgi:enolase
MSNDDKLSERTKIENYLRDYQLQECLDEAINELIDVRPPNPYLHIARFMETKTMAEIMDLKLRAVILGRALMGVEALVTTNLTVFSGIAPISKYVTSAASSEASLLDFSMIESKVKEAIRGLDPCNLRVIDNELLEVPGITPPVALAISIACCRAGARHNGKTLVRYLAAMLDSAASPHLPRVPVPVVSVVSRAAQGSILVSQQVTVIPTTPTFAEGGVEACLGAAKCVLKKLDELKLPNTVSDQGCPVVTGAAATLDDLLQLVAQALYEETAEGSPKLGIDYRAADLLAAHAGGVGAAAEEGGGAEATSASTFSYQLASAQPDEEADAAAGTDSGPPPPLSGQDVAALHASLWRRTGIITLEDPLALRDVSGLAALRDSLQETVVSIKNSDSQELAYNLKGIAGEERCILQVIADRSISCAKDLDLVVAPFNTVKINLFSALGSVYNALQMCKTAKGKLLSLVVGVIEDGPESNDSFVVDFAVAVGAGQFYGGGMCGGEYVSKFTRLVEIATEDEGIRYAGRAFRGPY